MQGRWFGHSRFQRRFKHLQIVQLGATDTEIVNMAAIAAFGVGG